MEGDDRLEDDDDEFDAVKLVLDMRVDGEEQPALMHHVDTEKPDPFAFAGDDQDHSETETFALKTNSKESRRVVQESDDDHAKRDQERRERGHGILGSKDMVGDYDEPDAAVDDERASDLQPNQYDDLEGDEAMKHMEEDFGSKEIDQDESSDGEEEVDYDPAGDSDEDEMELLRKIRRDKKEREKFERRRKKEAIEEDAELEAWAKEREETARETERLKARIRNRSAADALKERVFEPLELLALIRSIDINSVKYGFITELPPLPDFGEANVKFLAEEDSKRRQTAENTRKQASQPPVKGTMPTPIAIPRLSMPSALSDDDIALDSSSESENEAEKAATKAAKDAKSMRLCTGSGGLKIEKKKSTMGLYLGAGGESSRSKIIENLRRKNAENTMKKLLVLEAERCRAELEEPDPDEEDAVNADDFVDETQSPLSDPPVTLEADHLDAIKEPHPSQDENVGVDVVDGEEIVSGVEETQVVEYDQEESEGELESGSISNRPLSRLRRMANSVDSGDRGIPCDLIDDEAEESGNENPSGSEEEDDAQARAEVQKMMVADREIDGNAESNAALHQQMLADDDNCATEAMKENLGLLELAHQVKPRISHSATYNRMATPSKHSTGDENAEDVGPIDMDAYIVKGRKQIVAKKDLRRLLQADLKARKNSFEDHVDPEDHERGHENLFAKRIQRTQSQLAKSGMVRSTSKSLTRSDSIQSFNRYNNVPLARSTSSSNRLALLNRSNSTGLSAPVTLPRQGSLLVHSPEEVARIKERSLNASRSTAAKRSFVFARDKTAVENNDGESTEQPGTYVPAPSATEPPSKKSRVDATKHRSDFQPHKPPRSTSLLKTLSRGSQIQRRPSRTKQ